MTWTPEAVMERIVECAETLKALPQERPAGYRSTMPAYIRTAFETYMNDGDPWGLYRNLKKAPKTMPSNGAIDRCIDTLHWLAWLHLREKRVLLAIAAGAMWYELEGRFKRSRRTILRWQRKALEKICERLNR